MDIVHQALAGVLDGTAGQHIFQDVAAVAQFSHQLQGALARPKRQASLQSESHGCPPR
ncbi:hypothetical protein D3C71_1944590 [compost metagenome]